MPASSVSCGHCGKPPIGQVGDVPLCVDCYSKLLNAHTAAESVKLHQARHAMAMANNALDEMSAVVGLPALGPRIQIPTMPSTGPVTLNNIKLENSTVGVINTGQIRDIDLTITAFQKAGKPDVEEALRAFTQAVVSSAVMTAEQKNDLLDQIAFLSHQAIAPADQRKPGMIKAALSAIKDGASTVTAVAAAWQVAAPILSSLFVS